MEIQFTNIIIHRGWAVVINIGCTAKLQVAEGKDASKSKNFVRYVYPRLTVFLQQSN